MTSALVNQGLEEDGFKPDQAELYMKPNATIELGLEEASALIGLIEGLEELDDVNRVSHNLELTDEVVAQLA